MEKGDVFVISAPSGSGKTTICRMLVQRVENIQLSVSYTPRPRKEGGGGGKVKQELPEAVLVGIFPPDWESLEKRLIGRGRDTSEEMKARLRAAADEARQLLSSDYLGVNDDLGAAVTRVEWIVRAARLRRDRALVRMSKIVDRTGEGEPWHE